MSASFKWDIAKHSGRDLAHGTSSDAEPLRRVFGETISTKDIEKLRAMHLVTRQKESIWSELADVLEGLPDGTEIKVWAEY